MAETNLNLCRVHYDPATGTLWRWDGLLFRPLLDPFVSFDGPTGHVGLAGYKADATNALGVKGTNFLLDNEGGSVRVLFNKKTAADDASFGFETGYSARALIGLLGDDNFHFKVSPDGSTYYEAIVIDRNNGKVTFPQPTVGTAHASSPGHYSVASTTFNMNGYGSSLTYTAVKSGKALINLSVGLDAAAGAQADLKGYYGTGSAPAAGAAVTGTQFSGIVYNYTAGSRTIVPAVLIGLADVVAGTAYWFDCALCVDTGSATVQTWSPAVTVVEIMGS